MGANVNAGTILSSISAVLDEPRPHWVSPSTWAHLQRARTGLLEDATAVRQGDDEWNDIVRWTLFAMIQAEEFGITSKNVEQVKGETKNPDIQRFLGVIEEKGKELGMPNDFAVKIVTQVGNYGESFERNLGQSTPLKIQRGLNALWKNGGLMYNPPFR